MLGSGSGYGRLCVMYMPLCVSGAGIYSDDKSDAKKSPRDDTYNIITLGPEKNKPDFALSILLIP